MKKLILITILLIISFSKLTNSQWLNQPSGQASMNLTAIEFPFNITTGWCIGSNAYSSVILSTTNGGTNWAPQHSDGLNTLTALSMPTTTIGFAGGYVRGTSTGIVYKTTNGGANWNFLLSVGSEKVNNLIFINILNGFLLFHNGLIFHTTNGGVNWSSQSSGTNQALNAGSFVNGSTGWLVGTSGYIIYTTNTGANWTYQGSGSAANYYGIDYVSGQIVYVCGAGGRIVKSTNMGANWVIQTSNTTENLRCIKFKNPLTGWACGDNGVMRKTADGGVTWGTQNSISTSTLYEVNFPVNTDTGWASGGSGKIIKTTNGGGGFVGLQQIGSSLPENFILCQNYPNPFNPGTQIRFRVPETGFTTLTVCNILGDVIANPVNEELRPGEYKIDFNGSKYSSGIYFYTVTSGRFTDTKKMILTK
jgi:photosystem II stability/assembly factor-like uncharacterized protein